MNAVPAKERLWDRVREVSVVQEARIEEMDRSVRWGRWLATSVCRLLHAARVDSDMSVRFLGGAKMRCEQKVEVRTSTYEEGHNAV